MYISKMSRVLQALMADIRRQRRIAESQSTQALKILQNFSFAFDEKNYNIKWKQ